MSEPRWIMVAVVSTVALAIVSNPTPAVSFCRVVAAVTVKTSLPVLFKTCWNPSGKPSAMVNAQVAAAVVNAPASANSVVYVAPRITPAASFGSLSAALPAVSKSAAALPLSFVCPESSHDVKLSSTAVGTLSCLFSINPSIASGDSEVAPAAKIVPKLCEDGEPSRMNG